MNDLPGARRPIASPARPKRGRGAGEASKGVRSPFDVFDSPLEGINLVEASAGTGKTWNICGVYLRLLLEHALEVQQILVVTFTKAATAELRERIRNRIVEMLAFVRTNVAGSADPFVERLAQTLESRGLARDEMVKRLDAALARFDEAAILTLHAWCHRALADTPFTAVMPHGVELLERDSELRLEVVRDFWRRHVASDDCSPELAGWLDARRDSPETFDALFARRLAKPLARILWPARIDEPAKPCLDRLKAAYAVARATWTSTRNDAVAALTTGLPGLHRGTYKQERIDDAAVAWNAFVGAGDPLVEIDAKLLRLFATSELIGKTKRGQVPPAHRFFDSAEAVLAARATAEAALANERLHLVKTLFDEGPGTLRMRKRERRVASYDDVLFDLYAALRADRALAASVRERFPAALVDEFQDTDPVQVGILEAVYGRGEATLFLVGDPKQAIYAFRHADLHTYLRARAFASAEYTLDENQRSTPGLIEAVNALFGANPHAFILDGLDYPPVRGGAKVRKVLRDTSAPRAEFCLWMLPEYANADRMQRSAAKQAAAQATAAEIARLLRAADDKTIVYDDKPLAPSHVAVLVRTHNEGAIVKEALAALGIASVELAHESVFRTRDAEDVARVLAAILDPGQTSLLRAALATELLGFDASEIAALSADESRLMARIQRFLGYRETWLAHGVGVMYREVLAGEQVSRRVLAREDGERRLTNLVHLGELLHTAAQTHPAPDALLRWLEAQMRDEAAEEVTQLRLESDRNLVQIVTIHKAKGLEYPVVFCPFPWDGYRRSEARVDAREYHDDDGAAVLDFRSADEIGAQDDATIAARIRREACAEGIRLLYVALTRASHRCYVVAGCYSANAYGNPSSRESCRSLLNWLVAGTGQSADDWLSGDATPGVIEHAWRDFAAGLAREVGCSPLPRDAGVPLVAAPTPPGSLRAAALPAKIPSPWRIGSFSGLYDGAVSEQAASDHDARVDDGAPRVAASELAPDDILHFPRGTYAGDCLHAAFERADLSAPGTWDDAIAYALRRHPVVLPNASPSLLPRMIARMLSDVVATELPQGIRLETVTRERRLSELAFDVPARGVTAHALNGLLHSLGYPVDRLAFARLDGYLKGYIDLVFEHGGRYYIADWKSNHLGDSPSDYDHAALAAAMARHGYHLQSLLYCVALARYLRRRVRGYRHDAHFGGAFYLFVRGVRPGWKCRDGQAAGVHFHRPDAATLARIDACLGSAGPQSGAKA